MIQLNSQSGGDVSHKHIIERADDNGKGEQPTPLLNDELFIKKVLEENYYIAGIFSHYVVTP